MTNFSSLTKSVSSGVLELPPEELTRSDFPEYVFKTLDDT
jgi:hypothetical protein